MHRPRPVRWSLSSATVLALVLAGLGSAGAGHGGQAARPSAAGTAPEVLTAALLTGDRVQVARWPDGGRTLTVDPAPRERVTAGYQHYAVGDQVYVIPSDAAPLIPEVLDPELFNVTKLDGYGYADATPVIIRHEPGVAAVRAASTAGLTTTAELSSIDAVAATADGDGRWWRTLTGHASAGTVARSGTGPLAGVRRVWLDEQVGVALSDSVPQIGAPQAWQQGYDGTGLTVAVLDTGIDADHPDLAGAVVAARNFTDADSATDRHGHGTHVASTISGSGAASGGSYVGVAPGAGLINGKVLGDSGSGQTSWVLAGMQWAAANADVVNMSLGSFPTDGTDPLSLALNALTGQHGTLFVVAAGNSGPSPRSVGAPGSADAALTVGSVDKADQLATSSSRGPRTGDWAVKPDVTAPGVGITAARAAGTALGPIVDEHYTRLSGTSMATPHVAGAAAILLQRDPDLAPQQVKAALMSTAVPHGGLSVYEQGGGRIDVPAALAVPVLADPAPLNLGYFPYPHDDAAAVRAEVSYTNRGDQTVTLDLSLQASAVPGPPVGPDLLSVDPATLVIPPGATAAATVELDVPALGSGLYGGYLVAAQDGQVVTRVPVGFHKEDERYDIAVQAVDRSGRPAGGSSNIAVLDVANMARFFRPGFAFTDGRVTVRVPPGRYAVLGAIMTYDDHGEFVQSTAFVGDPELTVTGDVELVLDAREANRIRIDTPAHETVPQGGVSFGYWRTAAQPGPLFNPTWLVQHAAQEYYSAPMGPVTLGAFEYYSRWRMAAPEAELAVAEPVALPLDAVLLRPPAVDGEHLLRIVDVGDGTAGDYADVDVTGAVALARRGPVSFLDQEAHAAVAGAAALVITNDVPGKLVGRLGIENGTIPTLSLTAEQGDTLRALMAGGEVTVRLSGTAWSPYVYDLVLVEPDRIPPDLHYSVTPEELATLQVSYHNDSPGHPMLEGRHFLRPFHSGSILLHPSIDGPRTRTEYLVGGDELGYQQTVYGQAPFEARLQEQGFTFYQPGGTVRKDWFRQVLRPALLPGVEATTRSGDTMVLRLFEWVDAGGNYFPNHIFGLAPYPGDTIETRVFRDGELVGEESGFPRESFPMAAGAATYRVELDVTRDADWWRRSTQTRTAWTFTSQRPQAGSEMLPLLSVDYHVPLDLANTALRPDERSAPPTMDLRVRHQAADLPGVAGARVWVSYDDGDTWRAAPARDRGDGRFQVVLPGPPSGGGDDAVSVRVEAWDADGNRVEQEIIRAWHLPDRN